jgi:hypothetical protein
MPSTNLIQKVIILRFGKGRKKMKRITKYEPSKDSMLPYKLVDNELSTELDAIHQLGRFEDLMQEYNINSIEELENILSSKFIAGGFRSVGKSIIAKGILYNILSEELGCPLEVVFKGMSDYVVEYKIKDEIVIGLISDIYESVGGKWIGSFIPKNYVLGTRKKYTIDIELNQYQKTWWLKGEKENE